jgi:hypothetical protein
MNAPVTTAGDNRPALITIDQLKIDFAHVSNAVTLIETAVAELPSVLEDEEDLALVTKVASGVIKYAKQVEEIRDAEGRPHLEAQRVINAFFMHDFGKRLDDALTSLEARSKPYLKKKSDKEKAAREAIEAAAREKANAAAQAARDAISTGNVEQVTRSLIEANALADVAAKASQQAAAPVSQLTKTVTTQGSARLQERWTFTDLDVNRVDLNALRPFIKQAAIEQALRDFIKSGRRQINGARIVNEAEAKFRR